MLAKVPGAVWVQHIFPCFERDDFPGPAVPELEQLRFIAQRAERARIVAERRAFSAEAAAEELMAQLHDASDISDEDVL